MKNLRVKNTLFLPIEKDAFFIKNAFLTYASASPLLSFFDEIFSFFSQIEEKENSQN